MELTLRMILLKTQGHKLSWKLLLNPFLFPECPGCLSIQPMTFIDQDLVVYFSCTMSVEYRSQSVLLSPLTTTSFCPCILKFYKYMAKIYVYVSSNFLKLFGHNSRNFIQFCLVLQAHIFKFLITDLKSYFVTRKIFHTHLLTLWCFYIQHTILLLIHSPYFHSKVLCFLPTIVIFPPKSVAPVQNRTFCRQYIHILKFAIKSFSSIFVLTYIFRTWFSED